MPSRWTTEEENQKREEIVSLYVQENKTIREVADVLGIAESTVFQRMGRLGIPSTPERKPTYLNTKKEVAYPDPSYKLAEFFGIMLGDGHISQGQVFVYVNRIAEKEYIFYVKELIEELFSTKAGSHRRKSGVITIIFISSVNLVEYLNKMGLWATNKVKEQVNVPSWIFKNKNYQRAFLRGFFDTDGSIYRLRFGIQMSFCNKSMPLLNSIRKMLIGLGYHPSDISDKNLYVTRRGDLKKYFDEIGWGNSKHYRRALQFGVPNLN